jgi:RNA polymerase sigma factor (sigma-70 family)
MATTHAGVILRHVRQLVAADPTDRLTDQQLLDRFTARREEAAFAALVRRHGPLVLGVCRRVLFNWHDAEDAFQATFLTLARKAGAIGKRESVGGWLYQVAYHLSVKARVRAATRQRHEGQVDYRTAADPLEEVTGRELLGVLDEEVQKLPERLRAPVVLCYLEGRTRDEAARQLGWSLGTFKRRLEQARDRLRVRLDRRGLALAAALLAAAPATAPAAPSALLVASAVKAALRDAPAIVPGPAARPLAALKLKMTSALLLAVGVIALGAALLPHRVAAGRGTEGTLKAEKAPSPGPSKQPAAAQPARPPENQEIIVSGRVVDADGKPVADASVALLGDPQLSPLGWSDDPRAVALTRTDREGHYRLQVARPTWECYRFVQAVAVAPGQGMGVSLLRADPKDVVIRLPREQVIRGKLITLEGQPAAGVKVYLGGFSEPGPGPGERLSVFFWEPPAGLPLWPGPLTTDAEGRFTLRGAAAGRIVTLQVRDEPFARQWLTVAADRKDPGAELTFPLAPGQVVEGQITGADTGRPVANARLHVQAGEEYGTRYGMDGRADGQGRFRINPFAGDIIRILAYPPAGEPYVALSREQKKPKGTIKHEVNLALPRGVLVHGRVEEAGSGKPLGGAVVYYHPSQANNKFLHENMLFDRPAVSGPDGSFTLAVLPGSGHLLIRGPTPDYLRQEVGTYQLSNGRPGGTRLYPTGLVPLDLDAKAETKEVKVTLRRGVTVRGNLVGPDGKPVARAVMLCRLNPQYTAYRPPGEVEVRDGRFELRGCDPEQTYPVYFLDGRNKWGARVEIAGKQAGAEPVTVRLVPCGSVELRFLNKEGKPVTGLHPFLEIVITPGVSRLNFKEGELFADSHFLGNIDPLNYRPDPQTDAQGRATLPALIPGATYRLTMNEGPGVKEFTVESGKTLTLPDVTVDRSN